MRDEVKIDGSAFFQLFLSAAAIIGEETNGVLAGEMVNKKNSRKYLVEVALPYQTGNPKSDETAIEEDENHNIEFILEHIGSRRSIGSYHSHPIAKRELFLGRDDEETMKGEYADGIEVIVSTLKTSRLAPVNVSPLKVEGSFRMQHDAYRMIFAAYSLHTRQNGDIGSKKRAILKIPKKIMKEYFH